MLLYIISALNFPVKFLVIKSTQRYYILFIQCFQTCRRYLTRTNVAATAHRFEHACQKKQSKRYIAYSDVVRITGFIFAILPLFYYPLKSFETLLFKLFSALLTYFVIHIKFVQISCKRVKNVYKKHYINAL